MRLTLLSLPLLLAARPLAAQASRLDADIDARVPQVISKVVAWRRDIHEHPELSNRETRTADIVAQHLRSLGLEVRTGVAHTGVVGVLKGGKPGPVVALRADMDALPVTEEVDVPFASKARSTYNGQDVGVMHACGHDAHTAMLMGVAEVLAGMRAEIPGTVKFIFQPAEEGPPVGEQGGAELMVTEGVLDNPKPSAIFGLHVFPYPTGEIRYRPGGTLAAADRFWIVVHGRQTHGAQPWSGVDPIVVASQIVLGLQTITSRQINVTTAPAIVTVGAINGGVRFNIIPDSVVMMGTIRTFDAAMRDDIHARIRRTAESIAQSAGATANVTIDSSSAVTYNDPALTASIVPSLQAAAGASHVAVGPLITASEDFSRYQQRIPGVFFFLGITPPGTDSSKVAPNHSPRFYVDEAAFPVGVRAMAHVAVDYLSRGGR
ncbi:MAG TPA: amidohydrolase [Gemmatimonadales bacterium]|jgi:amidohydrolase|nr:amidohydrolase [Gemmatimonadales bacterium]